MPAMGHQAAGYRVRGAQLWGVFSWLPPAMLARCGQAFAGWKQPPALPAPTPSHCGLPQAVAEMLKVNKTLESLNIESNFITSAGMMAVIKAMRENSTLAELKVDNQVGLQPDPEGQGSLSGRGSSAPPASASTPWVPQHMAEGMSLSPVAPGRDGEV